MNRRLRNVDWETWVHLPTSGPAYHYGVIAFVCSAVTALGLILSGGPLWCLMLPVATACLIVSRIRLLLGILVALVLLMSVQVSFYWPPAGLGRVEIGDALLTITAIVMVFAACRYLTFEQEIFPRSTIEPSLRRAEESLGRRELVWLALVAPICFVLSTMFLWLLEWFMRYASSYALQLRGFRAVLYIGGCLLVLVLASTVLGYMRLMRTSRFESRLRLYAEIWQWCGRDLWMIGRKRNKRKWR
jgi:hypothetical protein